MWFLWSSGRGGGAVGRACAVSVQREAIMVRPLSWAHRPGHNRGRSTGGPRLCRYCYPSICPQCRHGWSIQDYGGRLAQSMGRGRGELWMPEPAKSDRREPRSGERGDPQTTHRDPCRAVDLAFSMNAAAPNISNPGIRSVDEERRRRSEPMPQRASAELIVARVICRLTFQRSHSRLIDGEYEQSVGPKHGISASDGAFGSSGGQASHTARAILYYSTSITDNCQFLLYLENTGR
jgi:hypothetical protein